MLAKLQAVFNNTIHFISKCNKSNYTDSTFKYKHVGFGISCSDSNTVTILNDNIKVSDCHRRTYLVSKNQYLPVKTMPRVIISFSDCIFLINPDKCRIDLFALSSFAFSDQIMPPTTHQLSQHIFFLQQCTGCIII